MLCVLSLPTGLAGNWPKLQACHHRQTHQASASQPEQRAAAGCVERTAAGPWPDTLLRATKAWCLGSAAASRSVSNISQCARSNPRRPSAAQGSPEIIALLLAAHHCHASPAGPART
ncbi:hypothetical protein PISL3812_03607 [Talaromyces islandicus]|uniref:Uncharacterized protein n=1 Tax=Talaromyces islandicus TaxID=28573 RepID=A0A0U1LT65_TALIS|nr:hypothetical protein PISL3812_03607 [Talaromyces islandicus]